jgi:Fe-S cluster assembly ATP-binding protein
MWKNKRSRSKMSEKYLEIKDLHVNVEGKEILKGVNLEIKKGEVHSIMGPNGSGKSTLANVIMGHPKYEVTKGSVISLGENVLEMSPEERAVLGLFLSFQYPLEIPGLGFRTFLKSALTHKNEEKMSPREFTKMLKEKLEILKMDPSYIRRDLNVGFSGGEKKRAEMLQMLMLEPKMSILDETDSGLDIDSLKVVCDAVNELRKKGDFSALVITHYKRILTHLKPDYIHVMYNGKIIASGDHTFADELEEKGYKWLVEKEEAEAVSK